MPDRLLTPSKITAWLDCAHYLTLRNQVDAGLLSEPAPKFGSFARLVRQKGEQHEAECLAEHRRNGRSIQEIPGRGEREPFARWVTRVGNPFDGTADVVYQMPFVHGGMRGIADFVVRVEDPDTGAVSHEPVDAKLARSQAKPGHVLQLCFYADAIEALTGVRPRQMHLWLGSGHVETLAVNQFAPYWRRLRAQLAAMLAAETAPETVPEPCTHCEFCEFFDSCTGWWRGQDSLIYVAGIRTPERSVLTEHRVATLAELAVHPAGLDGIHPERMTRLAGQASLQVTARQNGDNPPPYTLIEPGVDPTWGHGLDLLPAPHDGDVFLDFEGHPFWRPDTGLFFLFGLLRRDSDGQWRYRTWWAHDLDEEAAAVTALIDTLHTRRDDHPDAHAYHYNHTERSSLETLTVRHGIREDDLRELVETGFFVDLYPVARNAIQAGVESYGLKSLERLTGFERGHDIDQGAGAVVEYDHYMTDRNGAALERIAAYNEDDVRATRALRDWLIGQRTPETPWRAAQTDDQGIPDLDERVARLHEFGPDTPEHLLGDVLQYWRNEWRAYCAPKRVKCQADPTTLFDDRETLTGLHSPQMIERIGKRGTAITPIMRFTFPPQITDAFRSDGGGVLYVTPDERTRFASIDALDLDAGQVDLLWNEESQEGGFLPGVVVVNDWVPPKPKPAVLAEFADRLLDPAGPAAHAVTAALLRRDLPAFTPGGGPAGGVFSDDLGDMTGWVTQLEHSFVAIQGPPGTGKTTRAAQLIVALIAAGKRVGITAMAHAAIDNLLTKVIEVFEASGAATALNAVRRPGPDTDHTLPDVIYAGSNKQCAAARFNLVAGSTWLFAGKDLRAAPVDVLFIDEAGQLALADALAASSSAHNLILLGDPAQLPHVTQAAHSGGAGRSVLGHVLGDDVTTLQPDRGVFLPRTWRMHPDVCRFISEQFYDGRLDNDPSCAGQTTAAGTGLRWLQSHHEGNSTQAVEEADLIAAELAGLIGTSWTNQHGDRQPLAVTDVMVVAPYNDQVHLIRERLAGDPVLAGVPVGTVDKFQGQEAAVVFFSMTTSTGADMTRGADFLFSRNRLNVAISRARCLAYLVCTDELLDTRAHTVDDMRLIATLNAFVEQARESTGPPA